MASFSKFRQQLEHAVRKVTKVDAWPATLVGAGSAPARSVVRFTNGLEQEVLNYRFSSVADLKVNVGYDPLLPGVLQVLGIRENINLIGQASSWSFWIPEHHENHEFPNPDTVWVHGAQFVPLNVVPTTGLTVRIYGSVLWGDGTWVGFQTETEDMTARVPSAGARFVLVEVNVDGTLEFTNGSTKATRNLLTYADIPVPTEGRKPICAIRLYDGQTTIYHDVRVGKPNDVIDLRWTDFPATHNHDTRYPRKWTGKTAAPTVDDDSGDGYAVGDRWIDETNDKEYVALDVTVGAAVWTETTGTGAGGAAWSDINTASADTPLDADKFGFWDVVDAALKSITWANIKAALKTYFDTLYAVAANGVTNGDSHDHNGGDGAQIAHGNLSGIGTNTHAAIDSHLASTSNPHNVTAAQAVAVPESGWIERSETWTRTGSHTFTISGDVTAVFRKGTKIRYKDGGTYEYGVVASSTYSAPDTTITLITNDDYAMAAAAITDKAISFAENPEGFPSSFNYTPTLSATGSMTIASSTVNIARWWTSGAHCHFIVDISVSFNGTASTGFLVTTPVTPVVDNTAFAANCRDTGLGAIPVGTGTCGTTNGLIFRKADVSNWTLAANSRVYGSGVFIF